MAKIKIQGIQDLIEIDDTIARSIRDRKMSPHDKNQEVMVGSILTRLGDIKYVNVQEEAQENNVYLEKLKAGYAQRDGLLSMDSVTRAKTAAWGHFSLFFYGVYKEYPKETLREEVEGVASEFYKENPDWSKPQMELWIGYLKLPRDFKMDVSCLRILSLTQSNEYATIQKNREYANHVQNSVDKSSGSDYAIW